MTTLLGIYIFFGLLLIALALPLLAKRIGPNLFYGFRVPSTLRDKKVWYPVNQLLARWMLASAAIFLVVAVSLYFVPGINVDQYSLVSLAGFALPFTVGLVHTFRYLRTLTK